MNPFRMMKDPTICSSKYDSIIRGNIPPLTGAHREQVEELEERVGLCATVA